jgi:uncharacterized membrane protein
MTRVKTFILGALAGVVLGATVFGAIFHLVLIGAVVAGVTGAGLHARRVMSARRTQKALKA